MGAIEPLLKTRTVVRISFLLFPVYRQKYRQKVLGAPSFRFGVAAEDCACFVLKICKFFGGFVELFRRFSAQNAAQCSPVAFMKRAP